MPEIAAIRRLVDEGYLFMSSSNCDYCGIPVEFWVRGTELVMVKPASMEEHNCRKVTA